MGSCVLPSEKIQNNEDPNNQQQQTRNEAKIETIDDDNLNNKTSNKHQQIIDVDLKIFTSITHNECNTKNKNKNKNPMKSCVALRRIDSALRYYDKLDILNNKQDEELFEDFMNEIYGEVINDIIHLNNHHCHELEEIHQELNECKINECQYTSRHHEI
eukprot:UN13037